MDYVQGMRHQRHDNLDNQDNQLYFQRVFSGKKWVYFEPPSYALSLFMPSITPVKLATALYVQFIFIKHHNTISVTCNYSRWIQNYILCIRSIITAWQDQILSYDICVSCLQSLKLAFIMRYSFKDMKIYMWIVLNW